MNKKISEVLSLMLVLIFAFAFCTSVSAEYGSRLYDGADLLTDSEESELLSTLDSFSEEKGYDVCIVTVDDYYDYNAYSINDLAETYLSDYYNDGIILAISMEDRDYSIHDTNYAISDDGIDCIEEDILSYMGEDDYYSAFTTFASDVEYYYGYYENGDTYGTDADYDYNADTGEYEYYSDTSASDSVLEYLIAAVVIGIIVAFAVTSYMKKQLTSVEFQRGASNYVDNGSLNITVSRDNFLYSTVSAVPKPKDPPPSSGGGSVSHGGGGSSSHSGHF